MTGLTPDINAVQAANGAKINAAAATNPQSGASPLTPATAQPGYNPALVNNLGETNAVVQADNAANPTVASLYGLPTDFNSQAAAAGAAKTAASSPDQARANQDKANHDVLAQYQSQIDGIMAAEAQARARITSAMTPVGAQAAGAATAEQARGGNLGSSIGQGAIQGATEAVQNDTNNQIEASNAFYETQLSKLFGDIAAAQNGKAKDLQTASEKSADDLISQINTNKSNAQTDTLTRAKAAITAGLDPTSSDPKKQQDYQAWVSQVAKLNGLSQDEVTGIFGTQKAAMDAATAATQKTQAETSLTTAQAAVAGQKTLSPGQALYDANGKQIASVPIANKYQSVTTTDDLGNQHVLVYDTTTGKFVGYATEGGGQGGASNAGGTAPAPSTSGVTLPPPPASAAASSPAVNKNDSHLPVAQTVNGTSYDKNGDPTSGKPAANAGVENTQAPFAQYGLLSKTNFNPQNTTDQLAQMYLDKYIKSGAVPTASTMGRNIKLGLMAAITSRAQDLYYKATGNPLPSPTIIKAQQDIIAGNYKLGNNLSIQEGTVKANVDLSLDNMTKSGLNSSGFKPLDELIDTVKNSLQDPNVGQFLAQNTTIQNELGSLLAVKNAGGTTVYDKLESAGIIGSSDSPAQIKTKVSALIKEAGNFADSLKNANATAYGFTDPLLMDSNNPARDSYLNPKADNSGAATGASGSSAVTAPDGTQVIITD